MAGQVCRASGGRSARRAADPEMVERRRAGGWETNTSGRRDAPGREGFAAFGKRLSSLRVRPVGSSVASKACSRRCHRGALCGRYRAWLSGEIGCRSVPGGTHRKKEEVQPGTASRENAAAGIWSVCDQQSAKAWRREARDIQLSRLYAYLREEEEQRNVHGTEAKDPKKAAGETERGESRASAAHARTHPRTGQVVASGGAWASPVLRSAHEQPGAGSFLFSSGTALASYAVAA